jgi:hypothetical protein
VLRAFPVTAAQGPVAIVAADGTELAWIDSLEQAGGVLRTVLEQELAQREFLPVIEQILAVTGGEPTEWSVVTDRGPRRFKVAHGDDVARLPAGSAVVTGSGAAKVAALRSFRFSPGEDTPNARRAFADPRAYPFGIT